MKRLISLKIIMIFILFPFWAIAQKSLEIVVSVSDTINVEADRFSVIIQYTDSAIIKQVHIGSEDDRAYKYMSSKCLKNIIETSEGRLDDGGEVRFLGSLNEKYCTISFESFEQRQRLTKELEQFKNIRSNELSPTCSKTGIDSRIIQKLIVSARSKASRLAEELGCSLGEIIEVEEINYGKGSGGWTAYPPLSLPPPDGMSNEEDKAVISAKYKFRFEAIR